MLAARDTTARILAIGVDPRPMGDTTDTLGRNDCDCKRQIDGKPLKIEQSWIVRCYRPPAACAAFASAPRRPPRLRGVPLEDRGCSPNGTPLVLSARPTLPQGNGVLLAALDSAAPSNAPVFLQRNGAVHKMNTPLSSRLGRRCPKETECCPQPSLPLLRGTRPCSSGGTGLSIK